MKTLTETYCLLVFQNTKLCLIKAQLKERITEERGKWGEIMAKQSSMVLIFSRIFKWKWNNDLTLCIQLILTMYCIGCGKIPWSTIESNLLELLLANNQEIMSVCIRHSVITLIVQCCWIEFESLGSLFLMNVLGSCFKSYFISFEAIAHFHPLVHLSCNLLGFQRPFFPPSKHKTFSIKWTSTLATGWMQHNSSSVSPPLMYTLDAFSHRTGEH